MMQEAEKRSKAVMRRNPLRLAGIRHGDIVKPATDRENFIIQAMARGRTKVELLSVWDATLGAPPSVLEIDTVVQTYWEYFNSLQREMRARRSGIPDASAVLDALTVEIIAAKQANNLPLASVLWGHYVKVYTTERRLKEIRLSEFRKIAKLMWKSICERYPMESLPEKRRQLQGMMEMLGIPLDVDEVLLDVSAESD